MAFAFDSAYLICHLAGIIYTQQQFHKGVFHAQGRMGNQTPVPDDGQAVL